MSSANYLNTNSSSNTKTIAAEGSRTIIEGYNLPVSQSVTLNSYYYIIGSVRANIIG